MIEKTPVGNLNVWTFFPTEMVVTYSKQYTLDGPYGMISIGKCKVLSRKP
jgi:hypothetical protein